jgi:hypothetical protein
MVPPFLDETMGENPMGHDGSKAFCSKFSPFLLFFKIKGILFYFSLIIFKP